ncbi:NAD(+) diphosphatase [Christensenellaceae bacterium OttesenSCG-928-K19]|nr:NAD(+) diphosphatase [Christensenellaceae bacterium OttesenSCG-928-K19]
MLQDIAPHVFDNSYSPSTPDGGSIILYFENDTVLLHRQNGVASFPLLNDIQNAVELKNNLIYLFSIDGVGYYLANEKPRLPQGWRMEHTSLFRSTQPPYVSFAGITALQLYRWYQGNQFCGRCAAPMQHAADERRVFCKACGYEEYPRIAPAVIVGIVNGDKIVLTKYAGRAYSYYALVAGFAEVGESIEQTIRREVLEEVGLHVKNIRFYKSQPWSFSDSLLLGFFADLDGSDVIRLDEDELAEAGWFTREEVVPDSSTISLTAEMMRAFRDGHIK